MLQESAWYLVLFYYAKNIKRMKTVFCYVPIIHSHSLVSSMKRGGVSCLRAL